MNLSQTPLAPLVTHLLDLLRQLEGSGVEPTLAGGFGLFLRREWITETRADTLIQPIPEVRSTEDFDLLLSLEVLANNAKAQMLRDTIEALGYRVFRDARYFQFAKARTSWGTAWEVKIDLLAPQPEPDDPILKVNRPRVTQRKGNSPLHAYITPEAIAVEERRMEVFLEGTCTNDEFYCGKVWLPNALTLYIMKLHAFRDQEEGTRREPNLDYARKHAADLYTLTALLRQQDYDDALVIAHQFRNHPALLEACQIVDQYFGNENFIGTLRVREQPNFSAANLPQFIRVLRQIFFR